MGIGSEWLKTVLPTGATGSSSRPVRIIKMLSIFIFDDKK